MRIEELISRQKPRRRVQGTAAALLPYERDGRIAVETFQQHLKATQRAGLMNAVNMDTGYVNYLTDAEKRDVLRWTWEALGKDVPFVAGAYIENQTGDIVELYRRQIDCIVSFRWHPHHLPDCAPAWSVRERQSRHVPGGVPGISTGAGI